MISYDRLIVEFSKEIRTLCYMNIKWKGCGHIVELDDAYQESMKQLWTDAREFASVDEFKAKLKKAINTAVIRLKRQSIQQQGQLVYCSNLFDVDSKIADLAEVREENKLMYQYIQELPKTLKEAFYLLTIEGLEYKSIARSLNITEDTARKRVERAREILRAKLQQH